MSPLSQTVAGWTARGWKLETMTESTAVLAAGSKPNHVLHAILTLFTCGLWGFIWLYLGATMHEQQVTMTLQEDGSVAVLGPVKR